MENAFKILEKYGEVKVTIYQNRDYENPFTFICKNLKEIDPLFESVSDDVRFDINN